MLQGWNFSQRYFFSRNSNEKPRHKTWINAIRRDIGPYFQMYLGQQKFVLFTFVTKITDSLVQEPCLAERSRKVKGQRVLTVQSAVTASWLLMQCPVFSPASLRKLPRQRKRDVRCEIVRRPQQTQAVSSEEDSDADDGWAGTQRSSRHLNTSSSLSRPADDFRGDTAPSWSGQVSHGDDVPAVVGYRGFSAEADLAAEVATLQEHLQGRLGE